MTGIVKCFKCHARYWSKGFRCPKCGAFQPLASPKRFYALLAVLFGPHLILIILFTTFIDPSTAIDFFRDTVPGNSVRARFVANLDDCRTRSTLIEESGRAVPARSGAAGFNDTRRAQAYRTPSEEDCLRDQQCWEPYKFDKASKICALGVQEYLTSEIEEEQVPYSWIAESQAPNFTRYLRHPKAGVCTYIGGNIEIQNSQGDWENTIYMCDFDVEAGEVVDVRFEFGNLL